MRTPTPGLLSFDYVRPDSFSEVCRLLAEHDGEARPFMGGTDIFVQMRDGAVHPELLLDVKHLPGMREIKWDDAGGLTVGAVCDCRVPTCSTWPRAGRAVTCRFRKGTVPFSLRENRDSPKFSADPDGSRIAHAVLDALVSASDSRAAASSLAT